MELPPTLGPKSNNVLGKSLVVCGYGQNSMAAILNVNFQFQFFYCHRITKFPNKLYNYSVSCDNEDWTHKSMCPLSIC